MKHAAFPPFVRGLPEADLPFAGLRGWILQGETSQLVFLEADSQVEVAEHSHGEQWGFVVAGEMTLAVGGASATFSQGESYHIPAGAVHRALLRPGFRAVDCFADPHRYRPKRPAGRP